jgi:hypothetical protein
VNSDNRVRIRKDVNEILNYYIHEQGVNIAGVPGLTAKKNDVITELVITMLAEKGHWPPKNGKGESVIAAEDTPTITKDAGE